MGNTCDKVDKQITEVTLFDKFTKKVLKIPSDFDEHYNDQALSAKLKHYASESKFKLCISANPQGAIKSARDQKRHKY